MFNFIKIVKKNFQIVIFKNLKVIKYVLITLKANIKVFIFKGNFNYLNLFKIDQMYGLINFQFIFFMIPNFYLKFKFKNSFIIYFANFDCFLFKFNQIVVLCLVTIIITNHLKISFKFNLFVKCYSMIIETLYLNLNLFMNLK
jgi:hypothetical protein